MATKPTVIKKRFKISHNLNDLPGNGDVDVLVAAATTSSTGIGTYTGASTNITASVATTSATGLGDYTAGTDGVGSTLVYSNADGKMDGVYLTETMTVVVKDATDPIHNGYYTVTSVLGGGQDITLTRNTSYDTTAELDTKTATVTYGTVNAGKKFKFAVESATELDAGEVTVSALDGIGDTLVFNALTMDGVTISLNDKLLIKDATNAMHNGIYTAGTPGVSSVTLTRNTSFDFSTELISGVTAKVTGGTVNINRVYTATVSSGDMDVSTKSFAMSYQPEVCVFARRAIYRTGGFSRWRKFATKNTLALAITAANTAYGGTLYLVNESDFAL